MRLDARGLTLAEVLVAVALIGIGLVGVMVVVPIASYGLQEGAQVSTATFLAEQRLEEARNAPWQANPPNDCLGVGPTGPPTSMDCTRPAPTPCVAKTSCTTFPDEPSVPGYGGYRRILRVTDCGVAPGCGVGTGAVQDPNLRLVTVTVSFTPLTGAGVGTSQKSVTLQLLIAKRL